MTKAIAYFTVFVLLAGCESVKYRAVTKPLPRLDVQLADPAWTGKQIPLDQVCSSHGGVAATPKLHIENIPEGANAIIVEFNDRDYPGRNRNGGHGKIGFWIDKQAAVTLMPVEAETSSVEAPAFVESDSRSDVVGYLPPCSGGKGNRYYALVKAVYKPLSDEERALLLAIGRIELGRY